MANKALVALKQKVRLLHLEFVANDNVNAGEISGPQSLFESQRH